ncbi:hypothetical protein BO79DRAFT_269836 [Aspergillus costaricaensis CBS 115574]|uniref:Uncharacterized protein n=1 Tax=Aspergillus costaricaensis CBS 115574 TaxID=1448317 RepID=A0ACD1I977_9EURO|nr:hypothetical protein BO79DRAFT_269836 [Aspergillus costaricaensis CBS 115574]RAK86882.1 hypothetical protein BO79DRAFT_269836 [Aspergillus costaricaensis CBS 115574]
MSHPINKFQPFPNFYVYRPGYMVVPLIPLDELPSWIQVGDFDWGDSSLYETMLPASFNCFARIGEYDVICHHCYKNVDSYHRSVSERSDSNASSRASDLPKGLTAQLPANSILLDPSFKLEQPPFGANLNSEHEEQHPPSHQNTPPPADLPGHPPPPNTPENPLVNNPEDSPNPPANPPLNSPPESPDHSNPSLPEEEGIPLVTMSHSDQGHRASQASQAAQAAQAAQAFQAFQAFQALQENGTHTPGHAASASASVEHTQPQTNGGSETATSGDSGNSSFGRGRARHRDRLNRRGQLFEDDVSAPEMGIDRIDSVVAGLSGILVETDVVSVLQSCIVISPPYSIPSFYSS